MMGGALGLAVLTSIASSRTSSVSDSLGHAAALTSGYHAAFIGGAISAVLAATIGALLLREREAPVAHGEYEAAPAGGFE
jgi:hypothetical protein